VKPSRILIAFLLAVHFVHVGAADEAAEDERMLGHLLSLARIFARVTADSADADATRRGIDAILSGSNAQANRAASGLLELIGADLPAGARDALTAIGRDLAVVARREQARNLGAPAADGTERALRARRDLTSIGLSYHDQVQFLDAVRRGDRLAVQLYVEGRGVRLAERDASGRTAIDLARAAGDDQMVAILLRGE